LAIRWRSSFEPNAACLSQVRHELQTDHYLDGYRIEIIEQPSVAETKG
jgi:hypothetical protein